MSEDTGQTERLERLLAALAAFVSAMPGAPMSDPGVARDRATAFFEAVRDRGVSAQDATDKLHDLLRRGPAETADLDRPARAFLARQLQAEFPLDLPALSARPRPLTMVFRDEAGEPLGGLAGSTAGAWLNIDLFWLPPEMRGAGKGSDLLRRAEAEAAARGCTGAWLATIVDRAAGFYERHGYRVEMSLENPPFGFTTHWLVKRGLGSAQG